VDVSGLPTGAAEFVLSDALDVFGTAQHGICGKNLLLYSGTVPPLPCLRTSQRSRARAGPWRSPGILLLIRGSPARSSPITCTGGLTARRHRQDPDRHRILDPCGCGQDLPDQDGTYYYSVTSVVCSGARASSHPSPGPVRPHGPAAPANFALALTGNGVAATWTAPVGETAAAYRLYRSNGPITSTAGLTPVATAVAVTATDADRQKPIPTMPSPPLTPWAMKAACQRAGRSSPVSPVRNLVLSRVEQAAPQLAWDAPATEASSDTISTGTTAASSIRPSPTGCIPTVTMQAAELPTQSRPWTIGEREPQKDRHPA